MNPSRVVRKIKNPLAKRTSEIVAKYFVPSFFFGFFFGLFFSVLMFFTPPAQAGVISVMAHGLRSADQGEEAVTAVMAGRPLPDDGGIKTAVKIEINVDKILGRMRIKVSEASKVILHLTCAVYKITSPASTQPNFEKVRALRASCVTAEKLPYSVAVLKTGSSLTAVFSEQNDGDETDPRFDIVQATTADTF